MSEDELIRSSRRDSEDAFPGYRQYAAAALPFCLELERGLQAANGIFDCSKIISESCSMANAIAKEMSEHERKANG